MQRMGLVPVPEENTPQEETMLIFSAAEVEPIVVSAAVERAVEMSAKRLYVPSFELWRLAEIPAYRRGKARTIVLGFPSPLLDQRPELVYDALREALNLTWVGEHPVDLSEIDGISGVTVLQSGQDGQDGQDGQGGGSGLWPVLTQAVEFALSSELSVDGLIGELPDSLPEPEDAGRELQWRYALEAARQEPFTLRLSSQGLVAGEAPDPELVQTGHGLLVERRALAYESRFPTFETPAGGGVIVMAPKSAIGFYRDLAHDARRHRGCAVSVLAFDSNEPALVEFETSPKNLSDIMELVREAFPTHVVQGFGCRGFAIKGPESGQQDLLTRLLEILSLS